MNKDEALRFRKAIVEQDILCSISIFDEILDEFVAGTFIDKDALPSIKPCVKCGCDGFTDTYCTSGYGRGYPSKQPGPQHGKHCVVCYDRHCNHQVGWFDTEKEAIEAWNAKSGRVL